MVHINDVHSLQDHSGQIVAGSIIEWTKTVDRDIETVSEDDASEYIDWAEQVVPGNSLFSESYFKQSVDMFDLTDDWSEGHELFRTYIQENAREVLISAIRSVRVEHDIPEFLRKKKERSKKRRTRSDMIWYEIVLSLSTMGHSRGAVLATNKSKYETVTYNTVVDIDTEDRPEYFESALRESNVRYPNKKARWLSENILLIENMGGISAANEAFRQAGGRNEKMSFLKQFMGIGDKYARNIGMDLHHPDFRDTIALDDRIRGLSNSLGLRFDDYDTHEEFYRDTAKQLELTPWELDRILYNFEEEIRQRISDA